MLKEKMLKNAITITAAITAFLVMLCIFAWSSVYADGELEFDKNELNLDKIADISDAELHLTDDCEESIDYVEVSKEGIIDYEYSNYHIDVYAIKKGDVVLTVYGDGDSEVKIPVHVGETAVRNAIKHNLSDDIHLYYGDRFFYVYTMKGDKVTVKIGKDKYSAVSKKHKEFDGGSAVAKIKLKKIYNVGTKVKYTVERDGVAYKDSIKVTAYTPLLYVKAKGKKLEVSFSNIHKGDTITIQCGGRKYTKKIKKNYKKWSVGFKFKLKKSVKKNAKIKVTIRNKYKTRLGNWNLKLYGYGWDNPELF